MPNLKKKNIPSRIKKSMIEQDLVIQEPLPVNRPNFFSKKNIILVSILILVVVLWKFKGYFIAATVNGQPVFRKELNQLLFRRFGSQILDNIINEKLIVSSLRQKGILITPSEIDARVKQVEDRLQGTVSLEEALKAQGLTKEELRQQIEIQLSIVKLFDKEASVSTQEIEDYLKENKEAFKTATDPALVKQDVENILKQQKVGDLFNQWFSDLQKKATIKKFI